MKEISTYESDDGKRKSVIFFNEDNWCYMVYRYHTEFGHESSAEKMYEFPTLRQAENMAEDWTVVYSYR